MRPEDAAEHHQLTISQADLVSAVPESTRRSFERLRDTHCYGVLSYDLFTLVDDLSPLVLEQALGERFLEFYGGSIPFVGSDGTVKPLTATYFDEVYSALRKKGGTHAKGRWRLQASGSEQLFDFNGSFTSLLDWARREGLLRGQRNRRLEQALVDFRNRAAHPTGFHVTSPVDSAGAIRDVAEIINHLWGASTPGGRLYPAPIRRDIVAIGWDSEERSLAIMTAEVLTSRDVEEGWKYLLVKGVLSDENLRAFHSDYETTLFPSEFLWGPGSRVEALDWLESEQPQTDEVEYLDRWFLIRSRGDQVDLPRRAEVAAGLTSESRDGTWYLIRADFPNDALWHARNINSGVAECPSAGPCPNCNVETVDTGSWREVLDVFESLHGAINVLVSTAKVAVPSRWP